MRYVLCVRSLGATIVRYSKFDILKGVAAVVAMVAVGEC